MVLNRYCKKHGTYYFSIRGCPICRREKIVNKFIDKGNIGVKK